MNDEQNENRIIQRIIRKAGVPGLLDALVTRLSLSDLQSLLLDVYHRRVSRLRVADVLRNYTRNRFTRIADVNPSEAAKFDSLAFGELPAGFEPIELSPVAPLGSSSVLAPVHQNKAVTTIRNTEVLCDPTNVMALECAVRRKAHGPDRVVKLCCSERLIRAQAFSGPATFPHFRVLSLCTAGRDTGHSAFETESIVEHIEYYVRVIVAAESIGYHATAVRVRLIVSSERMIPVVEGPIKERLIRDCPDVTVETESQSTRPAGYYDAMRFNLFATNDAGQEYFLVDGGLTDWTRKLLQDRKERLMTSGMGTERFLLCFRRA